MTKRTATQGVLTNPRSAAVVLTAAAMLAGCGDQSADVRSVNDAARDLAKVNSAAPAGYETVTASLGRVEVSRDSATAAIAGLKSQSLQGTGSAEMRAALNAERATVPILDEAERLSRRYSELSTNSRSLAAFDPSEDLRRITQQAAGLADEAESVREERGRLAARIGDLESQVSELDASSSKLRNRAAEMKLASASATATVAARQATEIRGLTREADGLDKQANRIKGEIETMRPALAELDAEVAKLVEQRRLAIESGEELEALRAEWAEQAVRAKAEAATIAGRIAELVDAVAETRSGTVIPMHEQAASALERASSSADQASRSDQTTGRLTKAAAQRRLGDAHHLRAQGHGRFAALLEALAGTVPALPQADTYRGLAEGERSAEASERDLAIEAYEQAASAIRGSGIRGSENDMLESAAAELDALIAGLSGRGRTESPDSEASPGSAEDEQP